MVSKKEYALLLLDGEEPSKEFIEGFLKEASVIVATDGAAKYAYMHKIPLHAIIGDMDSLPSDIRKIFRERGVQIIEDCDQYSNDFEKALQWIKAENVSKNITILGIHGKRTDHLLTNFSVMLRYTNSFDSLIAYDTTHRYHFLTPIKNSFLFQSPIGTLVSITPLPKANGVITSGLYYPLKNVEMTFGEREGLSNVISEQNASVEITAGALLISIAY